MNDKNVYAVLFMENDFKSEELTLAFFETKEEVNDLIAKLHDRRTTITNQRLSYFSHVFEKGALYPTTYGEFNKETNNKNRKKYHVGAGYFVQRTEKNGEVKSEICNNQEDFDWQLDEWKEEGYTNVYVLNLSESLKGDYYYDRDIAKKWGEKEALFN